MNKGKTWRCNDVQGLSWPEVGIEDVDVEPSRGADRDSAIGMIVGARDNVEAEAVAARLEEEPLWNCIPRRSNSRLISLLSYVRCGF